jgi:tRNA A37 threonylcarbamoyladenosine dehydratase
MSAEELFMETHRIHPELLERQVRVLVVGCGGTGSAIVGGLPYLHRLWRAGTQEDCTSP